MLKINQKELHDKIYACWLGKNIGGTLGYPFEGQRNINDCTGFLSKPGVPLPNDDLDLQLIWLKAVREVGPFSLNSDILGAYWLEYTTPFWNEYGIGKSNMQNGIPPALSGAFKNNWKHSNGAWIRTEIWATLFPADTEMAVKYAFEDACVDHGVGDGTYAAIFVAAMESAAFIETDLRELIKIGLSNIPENCRFAKFINAVTDCYDSGMSWLETRNKITDMALEDPELGWFQAPTNVGYAVIGLLYGEGDFKKSMIISLNCGDDTDCSCATVGSILGIMHGTKIIPSDWQEYIGDTIVTKCVNIPSVDHDKSRYVLPKTCTDFKNLIIDTLPVTLATRPIEVTDGETERDENVIKMFYGDKLGLSDKPEYFYIKDFTFAKISVEYDSEPVISPLESKKIKIAITNKFAAQRVYNCRWILPDGWNVSGNNSIFTTNYKNAEFTVTAGENVSAKNTLILEITCDGSHAAMYVPVIFMG